MRFKKTMKTVLALLALVPSGQAASSCDMPTHNNTAFNQHDLDHQFTDTFTACCNLCMQNPKCVAYTWNRGTHSNCYLKSEPSNPRGDTGSVSSIVRAPPPAPTPPGTFRFSNVHGDGMVLQSAPQRAVVWGLTSLPNDEVTVQFDGQAFKATTALYGGNLTWRVTLPATPASLTATYNISATSAKSGKATALHDVLFGDVWICSGQSNMAYTLSSVNDSAAELADMANYPLIRLYETATYETMVPQIEITTQGGQFGTWHKPCMVNDNNQTMCDGRFSAACWFYGRDIFSKLDPPRPIGLIETDVGGTPDEAWSSADALRECYPDDIPCEGRCTGLWNGMVVPLLNSTVRGAIWYQGEADASHPGSSPGHPGGYNCTFPAMISDWRAKWHEATGGQTDPNFPFGFVQLNGDGPPTGYDNPPDDNRGAYSNNWGFAGLRWAQTAGYGHVPNPRMPNTFMAVILDTPNDQAGVHSQFKQPVGARLARAGLEIAYGIKQDTLGPRVQGVAWSSPTSLKLTLTDLGSGAGLQLHNDTGFEVYTPLVPNVTQPGEAIWTNAKITAHDRASVTISPVPSNGTRLRYLWYGNPCGLRCFECAVYTAATPLGGLSGEHSFLPLAPFIMDLPPPPHSYA